MLRANPDSARRVKVFSEELTKEFIKKFSKELFLLVCTKRKSVERGSGQAILGSVVCSPPPISTLLIVLVAFGS